MARLECDTARVAQRIVALLIDSFQSTNIDLTQQVDILFFILINHILHSSG